MTFSAIKFLLTHFPTEKGEHVQVRRRLAPRVACHLIKVVCCPKMKENFINRSGLIFHFWRSINGRF
jgi:hypothetical protein